MIKNCDNCGNELTGRRRRFCSSDCKTTFSAREKKAARHSMIDFNQKRTCAHCERPFTTTFRYRFKTYCSESCKKKAARDRRKRGVKSDFVLDTTAHKRTCQRCGNEFVGTELQVYCSMECMTTKECPCCGVIHNVSNDVCGGYCSNECKDIYDSIVIGEYRVCPECNVEFVRYWHEGHNIYCSSECLRIKNNRELLQRYHDNFVSEAQPVECACEECGTVFMSKTANGGKYCGDACRSRAQSRKWGGTHTQRARAAGVYYEYFDEIEVLEACGWVCYLCGEQTPKEFRGTYEGNAPEIEHIIPISQGGGHTPDNIACACRQCNSKKGNKTLLMSLYEINVC